VQGQLRATRLAVLVLLTSVLSVSLSAQTRLWRPDERVLLSDFSWVTAVAASNWRVYAATRHGLLIYDRGAQAWRAPVTALDGYPASLALVALADVTGNAVWLGLTDGWARYDEDLNRWERGYVAGGVRGLMLDNQDLAGGVYLRGPSGWAHLSRGALSPDPGPARLPPGNARVTTIDPETALQQSPSASAFRSLMLTDRRLQSHRFTAASNAPLQHELYLGTDGIGLIKMEDISGQWDVLSYGLLQSRADAVAAGARGVWVAGTAYGGERRGLTWLPEDLSTTTYLESAVGFGSAEVRRMLGVGDVMWVATNAGLFRVRTSGAGDMRRFDLGSGLASEDVRCLAPAPDGVWVGTAHGLSIVTADDRVTNFGSGGTTILSLLQVRESLWVGSAAGLALLAPGENAPRFVDADAALRSPIVALARVGDTLVAATADQLAWRDPAGGQWTLMRPGASSVGAITVLAADQGGVWVGGSIGLAFWSIGRSTFRSLRVPGDLPATIRDLIALPPYVWVATDSGLVRLRRDAVRP